MKQKQRDGKLFVIKERVFLGMRKRNKFELIHHSFSIHSNDVTFLLKYLKILEKKSCQTAHVFKARKRLELQAIPRVLSIQLSPKRLHTKKLCAGLCAPI